jgi:hypothetical protein
MNSAPPSWSGGASLDLEVLEKLRYDLGDDIVQRFMQNYVCLLPDRLDGVEEALSLRDLQKAVPILRDLRAAGSMLGTTGLASLADLMEQHLRQDRIDRAAAELPALRNEAAAVIRALSHVTWPGEGHSPSR